MPVCEFSRRLQVTDGRVLVKQPLLGKYKAICHREKSWLTLSTGKARGGAFLRP